MNLNIAQVLDEINQLQLRYQAGLVDERQMKGELELLKVKLKAVEVFEVDVKLHQLKAVLTGGKDG